MAFQFRQPARFVHRLGYTLILMKMLKVTGNILTKYAAAA